MSMIRQAILSNLNRSIRMNKPIIGVSAGAGICAKYAAMGGADMILALNSGRFRQMGFSSLAGMMPYENSNEMVSSFGSREILRVVKDIPVIFGLCASDPTIDVKSYIDKVYRLGFSGINNFPTVGIIDGSYRQALEESGISFDHEIRAIRLAREKNIFTLAFVFDGEQAGKMLDAGADVICAHLGFTRGGNLGVKSYLTLENAAKKAQEIFGSIRTSAGSIIKLVYGGPVKTPKDAEFIYNNTDAVGYVGGSSFDRIPTENAMVSITDEFKNRSESPLPGHYPGTDKRYLYIDLIKEYVTNHYMNDIAFSRIADELHLSRNYLSSLFSKEAGCTFQSYLARYRIRKAKELMNNQNATISEVADQVGFSDLAYFSRTFKRLTGQCPTEYLNDLK